MSCPNCGYKGANLRQGQLPDRILNLLEVEGSMTPLMLSASLNADSKAISRALWRLKEYGLAVKDGLEWELP